MGRILRWGVAATLPEFSEWTLRIGDSYDFPTLGFLRQLRFLGQSGSHSSEESPTARGTYL